MRDRSLDLLTNMSVIVTSVVPTISLTLSFSFSLSLSSFHMLLSVLQRLSTRWSQRSRLLAMHAYIHATCNPIYDSMLFSLRWYCFCWDFWRLIISVAVYGDLSTHTWSVSPWQGSGIIFRPTLTFHPGYPYLYERLGTIFHYSWLDDLINFKCV